MSVEEKLLKIRDAQEIRISYSAVCWACEFAMAILVRNSVFWSTEYLHLLALVSLLLPPFCFGSIHPSTNMTIWTVEEHYRHHHHHHHHHEHHTTKDGVDAVLEENGDDTYIPDDAEDGKHPLEALDSWLAWNKRQEQQQQDNK